MDACVRLESEIRAAIAMDAGDLKKIDKLIGNFLERSVHHHGRKAPSAGKLDQHWLTGFQNFGLEVCVIDLNCSFHVHLHLSLFQKSLASPREEDLPTLTAFER